MPSKETKKRIDIADDPLVSVVTPVFNAEKYLADSIQSICSQTYQNWELLVVNDASTDGSADIARELAGNDRRIHVYNLESNKGAAYCRNLATQKAKGDFIAFLDADDLWFPNKLEVQLSAMAKMQAPVCFSSYIKIDQDGHELGVLVQAIPKLTYSRQLVNNYIGNLTGIYHQASLGKIRAPDIRKRQDWAVWLEAIKRSEEPAHGIAEPLAAYRVHPGSMSAKKIRLLRYNFAFYRRHLGYSWSGSLWRMARFLCEYFFVRPFQIRKYEPKGG